MGCTVLSFQANCPGIGPILGRLAFLRNRLTASTTISRSPGPTVRKATPEIEEARDELARYARELTQDGRTVIGLYSAVMDGFRDIESDDPLDCFCEDEEEFIPCSERREEPPCYGLELSEFTDEEKLRIDDWVRGGLKRRAEVLSLGYP